MNAERKGTRRGKERKGAKAQGRKEGRGERKEGGIEGRGKKDEGRGMNAKA